MLISPASTGLRLIDGGIADEHGLPPFNRSYLNQWVSYKMHISGERDVDPFQFLLHSIFLCSAMHPIWASTAAGVVRTLYPPFSESPDTELLSARTHHRAPARATFASRLRGPSVPPPCGHLACFAPGISAWLCDRLLSRFASVLGLASGVCRRIPCFAFPPTFALPRPIACARLAPLGVARRSRRQAAPCLTPAVRALRGRRSYGPRPPYHPRRGGDPHRSGRPRHVVQGRS
jgi:hypothetical protein